MQIAYMLEGNKTLVAFTIHWCDMCLHCKKYNIDLQAFVEFN